ncbi:MAG: T9SS type A sorting domain-containing protein [Bacteroidales bacterium]|nr:T9SS type A sorting domain-containing protein [Bacteroidales bacterium]
MKRIFITLISGILFFFTGFAQNWITLMPDTKNREPKFAGYSKAFNEYWETHDYESGQAHKHFKREEWYVSPRLDEDGNFPGKLYYEQIEKITAQRKQTDNSWGDWQNLGPDYTPYWWQQGRLSGSGRLDCVEFHPNDTNTIWVGAHSGGFWKTTDSGQTWYTTTDHLPSIGVSSIVVNPENPDLLYIGTGDRDSFVTFGIGVLKSADGGETWEQTGLIYELPQNVIVNKLLIHPLQPEILYAATNQGIYKSSDAASNWLLMVQGNFRDLHFMEGNCEVMFCTSYNIFGNAKIYKSTNAGVSWTSVGTEVIVPSQVCRIALVTTPSNPKVLYAMCTRKYPSTYLYGIFRSDDAGESWQQTLSGDELNLLGRSAYGTDTEGYGWYTLTIAVSPTDENMVFTGGINLWKSTDGGHQWEIQTHENPGVPNTYNTWVDYHAMRFRPGTEQLFCCHDGGIIKTYNHGEDFENISDGLSILQVYKIGLAATNEELALCGPQDQFTMYRQNETDWNCIYFGESGENFFDFTNAHTFYVSGYGGGFRRTTNGGSSFQNITPQGVSLYNWLAPFLSHPGDPSTIFVGVNDVYRSYNQGTSWEKLSENLSASSQLTILEVAASNPDVMVAGTANVLWSTRNGGQNWVIISNSLPNLGITEMCISSSDAGRFYVTLGGFTDGVKVFSSGDYGDTWENISMNLPNVPATCIVYEDGSDDAVYVGTDLGVFYHNNAIDQWIDFGLGLPNVVLGELEIHYGSGKLRAGTYGRGLWETALMDPTILSASEDKEVEMYLYPNPVSDRLKFKIKSGSRLVSVSLVDILGKVVFSKQFDNFHHMSEKSLDVSSLPSGVYLVITETNEGKLNQKIIIE